MNVSEVIIEFEPVANENENICDDNERHTGALIG